MLTLRPYQTDCIDRLRESLSAQKRKQLPEVSAILESPTGSGKTAMASTMIGNCIEKGGSAAFVCHRKELIDQTALTFDKAALDYGYIASGYETKRSRVQICSVGTLSNRVSRIDAPDLLIFDECHHVGAKTWAHIRESWSSSVCVGLTATPVRLDGKGLGRWFQELVHGPKVATLMNDGFLSYYDAYAPVVPGTFKKRAGEFIRSEMESTLDTGEVLGNAVQHWKEKALGKKTLGFAITVSHSEHLVGAFRDAGVRAAHIDAKTRKAERRATLQEFAKGNIDIVFNVELFGEGYDLAANSGMDVTVEAGIFTRPTASLGLHLQQIGRVLRPKTTPAIILDLAGNLMRHGLPDDVRNWSLLDSESKESESSPKLCNACFAVIARHLTVCPYCDTVIPPTEAREIKEAEGHLEQIISGAGSARELQERLREQREEVIHARTLLDLMTIAGKRGLSDDWAEGIYLAKQSAGRRF